MLSEKDIITLLEQGADPQEIADKIANTFNAIIDKHQKKETKQQDTESLVQNITMYLDTYYPEIEYELTGDKLIEIIEGYNTALEVYDSLQVSQPELIELFNQAFQ